MENPHRSPGESSKASQWDGSPSALTPEGEIRVFERFASGPRASRSRRAKLAWAMFFALMVVPVLVVVGSWIAQLLGGF